MIKIKGHIKEGLEISQWLKDQGLVYEKDFVWFCKSQDQTVIFNFAADYRQLDQLESLIALKWAR